MGPWEAALGLSMAALHPRLRAYFSTIPDGSVGVGAGTFSVVGTPRAWIRAGLALFARAGILFPVWARDVPFTVVNRPVGSAVAAVRTFQFSGGSRDMVDEIDFEDGTLVDRLGRSGRISASFIPSVVDGALLLSSTRVRIWGVSLPSCAAPRVVLTESFDDELGYQRVSLTMTAPLIGRIYEYAGSFSYRIEEGTGS